LRLFLGEREKIPLYQYLLVEMQSEVLETRMTISPYFKRYQVK
jgi:hypothetical protein